LSFAWLRLRTTHGNTCERFLNQLLVMHIGAADSNADRHTRPFGQHRPLDTQLAPVGRVVPSFFPRPAATWSSPRPDFATATGCQSTRRILSRPYAIVSRTRHLRPTPESNCEWRCLHQAPGA